MKETIYDIAIIGGGLAGLTLSIKLAKCGRRVILFEKEQYPFHKVCGEYISMESWDYLQSLGLPLEDMDLPVIKKLLISSPAGDTLVADLPLGGFGISRYKIDAELKKIALLENVILLENCKVENAVFKNDMFLIQTPGGIFKSKVCCGSFGKRSNIDLKWSRSFVNKKNNKLNNYIGVKYHIETNADEQTIQLHNFKDGYCGLSKIEDNKYCLCYLTNAHNLKESGSIEKMEEHILSANPFLKNIFSNSIRLYSKPLTISHISFDKKNKVENHVLLTGDAAGMITPLCGNGMSMAIHAGKLAADIINQFLDKKITREEMEKNYTRSWNIQFENRLRTGRMIQRFFGRTWLSNIFIRTMKKLPGLTNRIIKSTHGERF
ncbi:MAG: NAD(P)/FAD-dependent oxidoreductase [Ferruginibacter sp.]